MNKKSEYLLLPLMVLGFISSSLVIADSHCGRAPAAKPQKVYPSFSSDCPCNVSPGELRTKMGNNFDINACVSRSDFSQLTGGGLTLTSQDYGETFSCFYQNFITDEIDEVVEYGSRDEIIGYHKACDRLIRDLAKYYKQPCRGK